MWFTSDNLPIAVQFIARPYHDTELLQLASLLEKVHPVSKLPRTTPALAGEEF